MEYLNENAEMAKCQLFLEMPRQEYSQEAIKHLELNLNLNSNLGALDSWASGS